MNAVQFRVARPTHQLDHITRFYTEGLGIPIIGGFKDHEGYDGVMLGLPDATYHLEFTQHSSQGPLPEPTAENLLVFYFDDPEAYRSANNRLQQLNCFPVKPENPYWEGKSHTYEDPDGWRIVLFNGVFTPALQH